MRQLESKYHKVMQQAERSDTKVCESPTVVVRLTSFVTPVPAGSDPKRGAIFAGKLGQPK